MTNKELENKITELERQVVNLRGIIMAGKYPDMKKIDDYQDFRGQVDFKNKVAMRNSVFIKSVNDISLTAIGDTSTSNQSTNITENFNKIINALNDD